MRKTTAYRYNGEYLILLLSIALVFTVIAVTVTATACISGIFVIIFVIFSVFMGRAHHQSLIAHAKKVDVESAPELNTLVGLTQKKLQPGPLRTYILPSRSANAYTFGLSSPKVIVLYSQLFKLMDAEELTFVIGHEMGHIALGHTWLNSIVGGMAGIPSSWSAGMLMTSAFLWWNRACEYSADRAGLLACGSIEKSVSALVKIAAGRQISSEAEFQEAYRRLDLQDDTISGNFQELLGSHPLIIKRIEKLRRYAQTNQYRNTQGVVNQNLI